MNIKFDRNLVIVDYIHEQGKPKMEDVLLFIFIPVHIVLGVIFIVSVCGLLHCLFFRPILSSIGDERINPGLYALDVPLQECSSRQSTLEIFNYTPSGYNHNFEPIGERV